MLKVIILGKLVIYQGQSTDSAGVHLQGDVIISTALEARLPTYHPQFTKSQQTSLPLH